VNARVCGVSFDYLLLSGSVSGDTADVMVWDLRDGHKLRFAQLTLSRDSDVLTIRPTLDPATLFPSEVRIGRHPSHDGKVPEPTTCMSLGWGHGFLSPPQQQQTDKPPQP
jgi:hypothetical protein